MHTKCFWITSIRCDQSNDWKVKKCKSFGASKPMGLSRIDKSTYVWGGCFGNLLRTDGKEGLLKSLVHSVSYCNK